MLSLQQAQQLLAAALEIAVNETLTIAVALVDAHGELVAFGRMDEVSPQAAVLAQNKAYTAARDRQPSGNLGAWARETGKDMGYWTDGKITGIAGGLPVFKDGKVIGGLGISGLSESEDEALGHRTLALLNE